MPSKHTEEFQDLSDKLRAYKILLLIGLLTSIFVIGLFVLVYVFSRSGELKQRIRRYVQIAQDKAQILRNKTEKNDTYLIYKERTALITQLDDFLREVNYFRHANLFDQNFSEYLNNSYESIVKAKDYVCDYNSVFVQARIKKYVFLFKKSPFELDYAQKTAVVTDEKHNLVVAGAGAGKTEVLTTRIAYLVKRKPDGIKEKRILVLAFQNKAAHEINKRLKKCFGINVKIKTFHALGLEILKEYSRSRKQKVPNVKFSGDNADKEQTSYVYSLFEKASLDKKFEHNLIQYMANYGDEPTKSETDFDTQREFFDYMSILRYTALDGTKVKSEAEQAILNFFFKNKLNGEKINIKYEEPASWMKYNNKDGERIPHPDFFFPAFDIYIEHWALDKNGNVPSWFPGDNPTEKYVHDMELKKQSFSKQDKYTLIESSHADFQSDDFTRIISERFLSSLKTKYPNEKFTFTPISYHELVKKVWGECSVACSPKSLAMQLSRFIVISKTYGLSPNEIDARLSSNEWSPKQVAFTKLAVDIFKLYQSELKKYDEIDFCDMINVAVENLSTDSKLYRNQFDHILIDEYQDISTQRENLIKQLMNKNEGCKLFCVGDDWQSIFGFAGANVDYFVNFESYFDHPARTDLEINYRSTKTIVDAGAKIISHNGEAQLSKTTKANNDVVRPIIVYSLVHQKDFRKPYHQQSAEHCVHAIEELLKKGYASRDILILARVVSIPSLVPPLMQYAHKRGINIGFEREDGNIVRLMSVHKAKGLQAKVVFILNVDDDLYGFPCKLEDPAIFDIAKIGKKAIPEHEERRLFYVAVTRAREQVIIYTQKCCKSSFLNEIEGAVDVIELPYQEWINSKSKKSEPT